MNTFLENVVARLPAPIAKYAKAFVPVGVAAAVVLQDLVVSAVEVDTLKALALGAVASIITGLIPNVEK